MSGRPLRSPYDGDWQPPYPQYSNSQQHDLGSPPRYYRQERQHYLPPLPPGYRYVLKPQYRQLYPPPPLGYHYVRRYPPPSPRGYRYVPRYPPAPLRRHDFEQHPLPFPPPDDRYVPIRRTQRPQIDYPRPPPQERPPGAYPKQLRRQQQNYQPLEESRQYQFQPLHASQPIPQPPLSGVPADPSSDCPLGYRRAHVLVRVADERSPSPPPVINEQRPDTPVEPENVHGAQHCVPDEHITTERKRRRALSEIARRQPESVQAENVSDALQRLALSTAPGTEHPEPSYAEFSNLRAGTTTASAIGAEHTTVPAKLPATIHVGRIYDAPGFTSGAEVHPSDLGRSRLPQIGWDRRRRKWEPRLMGD